MQVVNFSITLPDETHPAMQVHVYGQGVRELTVEVPPTEPSEVAAANRFRAKAPADDTASDAECRAQDEYELGGYAGI
jgi:hypothetical protein